MARPGLVVETPALVDFAGVLGCAARAGDEPVDRVDFFLAAAEAVERDAPTPPLFPERGRGEAEVFPAMFINLAAAVTSVPLATPLVVGPAAGPQDAAEQQVEP